MIDHCSLQCGIRNHVSQKGKRYLNQDKANGSTVGVTECSHDVGGASNGVGRVSCGNES